MTPAGYREAARLLAAGFKLCELHPNSKRPVGDGWNNQPVNVVRESAGGYGLMLALNGLVSVDLDSVGLAAEGLARCGFDMAWLREAGIWTNSTRPGSGGRVTFRAPKGVRLDWIKFSSRQHGTILELRATSPNLQDTLPGTVYFSADKSGPWEQQYTGPWGMDEAPELPAGLLQWWSLMSEDIDFKQAQQRLLVGEGAHVSISATGSKLAYQSTFRAAFNREHDVPEILARHEYTEHRNGRWAPSTATGAPAVREIEGKDDLWQSDHASDPLHGTFDAWVAHVVLDHEYDMAAAERAMAKAQADEAMAGFDDEPEPPPRRARDTPPPKKREDDESRMDLGFDEEDDDEGYDFGDQNANSRSAQKNTDIRIPTSGAAPPAVSGTPDVTDDDDDYDFGLTVPSHPLAGTELPVFDRDSKTGRIKNTVFNLKMALQHPDMLNLQVANDEFRGGLVVSSTDSPQWRPFKETDYFWLRVNLERPQSGFMPISHEMMRQAVHAVAEQNSFDSAQVWLTGLLANRAARRKAGAKLASKIDTFLSDFMGVADTPFHRAVSRYIWTALAGRVMVPGIQADMAVIFTGGQGLKKTSAIKAMVPGPEFYVEVSFDEPEEKLARKMRGKLIGEIAELRGLHTKDREANKAFMTRTHEEWVPKYQEFAIQFARRLIMFGTTNLEQFLVDDTGERRWIPVQILAEIDVAGIAANRDDLWAEALELFQANGVMWQDAQRLAMDEHETYSVVDEWWSVLDLYMSDPGMGETAPKNEPFVTTGRLLSEALHIEPKHQKRADQARVAAYLKKRGYFRKKVWADGRTMWGYVRQGE